MTEPGFHPAATAATTDEARAGRSELDLIIASDPEGVRSAGALLYDDPLSPEALQVVALSVVNAMAAFARSDWEINTFGMHADRFVFEAGGGQQKVMIDLPPRLVGVGEYIRGMEDFLSVWDPYEFVTEGVAIASGGDKVLQLGTSKGQGAGSGVPHQTPVAFIYELDGPWVISQRYWWDHELGMAEAGVEPADVLAVTPR